MVSQALPCLSAWDSPTPKHGSGSPLLLMVMVARGLASPLPSVLKQQPLLQGTEVLLSGDAECHPRLSYFAHFQHPSLISCQTGFYPWDTSSNFPSIQKGATIFRHYHSTENMYYKQQSCVGMPEPCCWLMHDLRKAHITVPHHSVLLCEMVTVPRRAHGT